MHPSRHRLILLAGTTAAAVVAGTLGTVVASAAAVGCRVDYQITNQWQGGFGANVTVTNLGDPVNGWALTWSYAAGPAGHPGVERRRHPVRRPGHRRATSTTTPPSPPTAAPRSASTARGPAATRCRAASRSTAPPAPAPHPPTSRPPRPRPRHPRRTPTTPPPTTPPPTTPPPSAGVVQMEKLDRGLISVRSGSGNLVSWRLLGTETSGVGVQPLPGGDQGQRQPDHRRHQLPRQRRGGRLGVHRAGRGGRRRAGGVGAGVAVRRGLPGRAVAGPGRRQHPQRRELQLQRQRRLRRRPQRRRQLRDRAQVGAVQRQGQLPVRLHRQRLRRRVHARRHPAVARSTWAATSAPAPTTPSSRCTTTTATAAPRWP